MGPNPLISELIRILNEETRLYAGLQTAVKDEHAALTHLSTPDLTAAGVEKARIVASAQKLEAQRSAVVDRIARELGLSAAAVRISDIAARIAPEEGEALMARRHDLVTVVTALHRDNQRNARMITSALSFVRGAIRLFDNLFNPQAVYQRTGRVSYSRPRGKMLSGNV